MTDVRIGQHEIVDDVTSRAAIVAGNGSDDYHEREAAVSERLNVLDGEIKNAQRRLDELAHNITQFEQLRAEVISRFPDLAGAPDAASAGTAAPRPAVAR